MGKWLLRKWRREPVLIIDTLKTIVMLGATFGLALSKEQEAAMYSALLALSMLTRSRVGPQPHTPKKKVKLSPKHFDDTLEENPDGQP